MTGRWGGALVLAIAAACGTGAPQPVTIDTAHDTCAACRMVISSTRTAAQILEAGEEPRLFDDLACLRTELRRARPPADAVVVVADHATGAWVPLAAAVVTEVPGLATPMGSGLVAHASAAARDGDPAARAGRSHDGRVWLDEAGGGR